MVASVGWTTERWPRFLSQDVHRNLSLFCVGFVAIHVVTTVSDGYVPIGFADAFIPFRTPYRPLYVGLGALSFDLLLAVLVTSALRHRIGFASWRFVHWLAYLCWPIALFHSLGSGTDSSLPLVLALDAVCAAAVGRRGGLAPGHRPDLHRRPAGRRRGGHGGGGSGPAGVRRPRPAPARLVPPGRHLDRPAGPTGPEERRSAGAGGGTAPPPRPAHHRGGGGPAPSPPFTVGLAGTQSTSGPDSQGQVQVVLSMHLQNAASTPLTVTLVGECGPGGGVAMSSGTVTLGPPTGWSPR